MNTEFEIRPVRVDDAEPLAELLSQMGKPILGEEVQLRLSLLFKHPDHQAFLAEIEGKPLGYIHAVHSIRLTSGPFLEIVGLVVSEKYRRSGIGRALVEFVEKNRSADKNNIRVRCNVKRKEAHAFYRSLRFEPKKEQKVFEFEG